MLARGAAGSLATNMLRVEFGHTSGFVSRVLTCPMSRFVLRHVDMKSEPCCQW
jgi:hypothetical protein